jgi:Anti-sigma-K factor rskA, C-terminal
VAENPSRELWAERQRELRRAWIRGTVIAAVALVVGALLGGGFVAARYEAQMGQVRREAFAFKERLREEDAARRARVSADERAVELLREPATRLITLRGAGAASSARGRVVWSEPAGGHILVSGLPPAPDDMTYVVWAIQGGKPRTASTLNVDVSGNGSQPLPPLGAVEAFLVTLEPASGSAAPTGPAALASR